LKTKDHFSSSWTSWVEGGKGHEFVVALAGVLAGLQGVADHGVFIDTAQASSLADATAVLEVPEDIESLLVGESAAEESRPFAFGETGLAGTAGEHTPLLARTVAEANAEVALATQAISRAVGVLTAEQIQAFHEQHHNKSSGWWTRPC
jgi:hypothetical protein